AFVISANIHRRHLTGEQKRDLIGKLIKAQPQKPDLQIAKTVKVSPTTVGTVRREMEAKGDVSNLETRTDTRGRNQPSSKPRKAKRARGGAPPPQLSNEALQPTAEQPHGLMGRPALPPRDDIGPDSASEADRLRVSVEELQAEKRRLEIKITGLEHEI